MAWYLWILAVILGLNAVAIALLGLMMLSDWFAQRRLKRVEYPTREDDEKDERG
jgi:hypothetical protein